MYFTSKAKPHALPLLAPLQNAAQLTTEGIGGARLWQGHCHRCQQWRSDEPPACSPVTDNTRVTQTHSSSWEMAPSSHTGSFSLLRKSRCAEDIIQVPVLGLPGGVAKGQDTGEVVAGLALENQVRRQSPSSLPALRFRDTGWKLHRLTKAFRCFKVFPTTLGISKEYLQGRQHLTRLCVLTP